MWQARANDCINRHSHLPHICHPPSLVYRPSGIHTSPPRNHRKRSSSSITHRTIRATTTPKYPKTLGKNPPTPKPKTRDKNMRFGRCDKDREKGGTRIVGCPLVVLLYVFYGELQFATPVAGTGTGTGGNRKCWIGLKIGNGGGIVQSE